MERQFWKGVPLNHPEDGVPLNHPEDLVGRDWTLDQCHGGLLP